MILYAVSAKYLHHVSALSFRIRNCAPEKSLMQLCNSFHTLAHKDFPKRCWEPEIPELAIAITNNKFV